MKKHRGIEKIYAGASPHWVGNGFRVSQYFPSGRDRDFMERFSPFILMDYNKPTVFPPSDSLVGVDVHPHRGFETVTFAFDGFVEHGDNKGGGGVIGPGDIQWMTAGSGIIHKEFHEREYAKRERVFHMIQLWVNLPAKHKMTEPRYQAITKDQMGKYPVADNGGEVTVYAGEVLGVKGPASTFSPMNIFRIDLKKGASIKISEPSGFNVGILLIRGDGKINEQTVQEHDFILMKNEEGAIEFSTSSNEGSFFVLSGQPLREPIVARGPFVMNTYEEIVQANEDFHNGKFGSMDF